MTDRPHKRNEASAYGLRKPLVDRRQGTRPGYPWEPFWRLAGELEAPAVVNSDAHRPEDLAGKVADALALAANLSDLGKQLRQEAKITKCQKLSRTFFASCLSCLPIFRHFLSFGI